MSCPFGTMDWYCCLPDGHDGPHQSYELPPSPTATPEPAGQSIEMTARGLTDEQLAAHIDRTVADFALAEKYEHNSHVRPAIRATLDALKAEKNRRIALLGKDLPRDPSAGEEPTTEKDTTDVDDLLAAINRYPHVYGADEKLLTRSFQESRSELADANAEIAALKQSIIQSQLRAEDAERKLARLELEKEALATGRVWCGRDRWWYGAIGPSANGPFDTAQDALDAALADHPEKP